MERSNEIILDYLVSSGKGEILKRNSQVSQELKKLKIGDKTYYFERAPKHKRKTPTV